MNHFIQAIAFLTRLPVTQWLGSEPGREPQALPWYPLVGALMGALLLALAWVMPSTLPAPVAAAVLLLALAWMSGALHLDGLADSMDAIMGAHAHPDRALEIMKDPRTGAMGAVALILALIFKFALLTALWPSNVSALFAALVLARANVLLLFYATPYVREGGLAEQFRENLSAKSLGLGLLSAVVLCLWLPVLDLLVIIGICLALLWWWRRLWIQRIRGFTGDIAGALIEMTEIAVMLFIVVLQHA